MARQTCGPQEKQAALDWNLESGSVTPAGVWTQTAIRELRRSGWLEAHRALPVLAALSIAMHDAFVDSWRVKLRDWSERPITAIRRDLDPNFVPLIVTPGFPAYTSGHSTVSGAAAETLGHFWPEESSRFDAMAQEASMSRLSGGIQLSLRQRGRAAPGRAVARDVIARVAAQA